LIKFLGGNPTQILARLRAFGFSLYFFFMEQQPHMPLLSFISPIMIKPIGQTMLTVAAVKTPSVCSKKATPTITMINGTNL
jgi:hypothetical protein